jgi:hypothetical protein
MKRTGSCSPPALTLAAGMALTAALVCGRVQAADAATAERFEGLAYERGTKHLIYKEVHLRYSEGAVARHLVLYQCPGGEVFARKELRETYGPMQPDFDFEDGRDGYREGVHSVNGSRQVYFQENRSAPLRAQPLPSTMPAVIDAGFDAYVRANWKHCLLGPRSRCRSWCPIDSSFWTFESPAHVRVSPDPSRRAGCGWVWETGSAFSYPGSSLPTIARERVFCSSRGSAPSAIPPGTIRMCGSSFRAGLSPGLLPKRSRRHGRCR